MGCLVLDERKKNETSFRLLYRASKLNATSSRAPSLVGALTCPVNSCTFQNLSLSWDPPGMDLIHGSRFYVLGSLTIEGRPNIIFIK